MNGIALTFGLVVLIMICAPGEFRIVRNMLEKKVRTALARLKAAPSLNMRIVSPVEPLRLQIFWLDQPLDTAGPLVHFVPFLNVKFYSGQCRGRQMARFPR